MPGSAAVPSTTGILSEERISRKRGSGRPATWAAEPTEMEPDRNNDNASPERTAAVSGSPNRSSLHRVPATCAHSGQERVYWWSIREAGAASWCDAPAQRPSYSLLEAVK